MFVNYEFVIEYMCMIVKNEGEMIELGREIGFGLKSGAILLLSGDLGTGKTTFVRGVARGLGIKEEVTSPSFVIEKTYTSPEGLVLRHFDLYRLGTDIGIIRETLKEAFADKIGIVIIEWGDEIENILPEETQRWRLTHTEDGNREVEKQ